jgi:hypothetical protein
MSIFKQYIPTIVDDRGMSRCVINFDTSQDLLLNSYFDHYKQLPNFSHFAMSENTLMAILDDGFIWYVLGFISDLNSVADIPLWDGGKYNININGVKTVVSNDKVYSSCAGYITLIDGSVYPKDVCY